MSARPRHPRKELEVLCQLLEEQGWRISKDSGYFKAYCPCGQHKRTIHLSPSDPNYEQNVRHWFQGQSCWAKMKKP